MRELNRPKLKAQVGDSVRINITLCGEPARWLRELKNLGLITSWHQGIIRAIETLHREFVDEGLKAAQLKNFSNASDGRSPE
jgi:hypothetical protein